MKKDPSVRFPEDAATKWMLGIGTVWMLIGLIAVFPKMFGVQFIPSTWWIDQFGTYIKLISWLSAVIFFLGLIESGFSQLPDLDDMKFRDVLFLVFSVPFYSIVFQTALFATVPAVLTLANGDAATMQVVVDDPHPRRNTFCRRGIEIRGRPLASLGGDSICGLDGSFRETLSEGQVLVVFGRGSFAGIFPDSVETLESYHDLVEPPLLKIDG